MKPFWRLSSIYFCNAFCSDIESAYIGPNLGWVPVINGMAWSNSVRGGRSDAFDSEKTFSNSCNSIGIAFMDSVAEVSMPLRLLGGKSRVEMSQKYSGSCSPSMVWRNDSGDTISIGLSVLSARHLL